MTFDAVALEGQALLNQIHQDLVHLRFDNAVIAVVMVALLIIIAFRRRP